MDGLLDRLRESYKAALRDILNAYRNPTHRVAADNKPSTQILSSTDTLAV